MSAGSADERLPELPALPSEFMVVLMAANESPIDDAIEPDPNVGEV